MHYYLPGREKSVRRTHEPDLRTPALANRDKATSAVIVQTLSDRPHEAFILMMAVEQRRTGVISDKIDFHAAEAGHVDRILHHATRDNEILFATNASHLFRGLSLHQACRLQGRGNDRTDIYRKRRGIVRAFGPFL